MFNNNFKNLIAACAPFPIQSGKSVTNPSGSTTSFVSIAWGGKSYSFASAKASSNYGSNSVVFGDSDQPATEDDCKLAGNIINNFSYNTATSISSESITNTFTITNNNDTEITIKEVCYVAYCYYYKSGWSGNGVAAVIDRTVLDTPVTIPAGGIGQVEYTITFNLPTA